MRGLTGSRCPPQAPKKKVAAAPAGIKKAAAPAKPTNPLYEKRAKSFGAWAGWA